jgi:hypothetical protein
MALTQQELKDLLDYEPATGLFTWKKCKYRPNIIGTEAGVIKSTGYVYIKINHKIYQAHRLAFLWMTGSWPQYQVDHISGCKTDNRWSNLRDVSNRENQCNQDRHRNGKLPGTHWHKQSNRWRACINVNGKVNHLGSFDTEEQAHQAYLIAKGFL